MKYLSKPFRFILGLILFVFYCVMFVLSTLAAFVWHLHFRRTRYIYKFFFEDFYDLGTKLDLIIEDDYPYTKYRSHVYLTFWDFVNNRVTVR